MAVLPARLFFKNNRLYGMFGFDSVFFDLILTEQHSFDANVTDRVIEDGSFLTDHIQNVPENASLTALVSNFSLNSFGLLTNRAQETFDILVFLWEERELMDIVTVMRVYEDVAITNVTVARDEDSGEAIIFQVTFKKVNVVTLQEIQLELSVKSSNLQVMGKFNAGRGTGF